MKLFSFLAGAAAGYLLKQWMDERYEAGRNTTATLPGGAERDYPTHSPPRSDAELRERICSKFERTIGHPEAIRVEVRDGCVTLRGQVHARDSMLLMAEVENIPGVKSVQNELQIQGSLLS